MIDETTLRKSLGRTLEQTNFTGLGELYRGKVRDNYALDASTRVMITTDRISAFDRVLGTLPLKGQVLTQLSKYWFEHTVDVFPNHFISCPDPNVMLVQSCKPLSIEVIVRAYLTGVTSTSVWTAYARGDRTFCGHPLPDGLKKNDRLPKPIVTPSTKAEKGGHDESVSGQSLVDSGVISQALYTQVEQAALALFAKGQAQCARQGLILVDTKYEFGISPSGQLMVIDEMHTPDSSRIWFADSYEASQKSGKDPEGLDKEYVRRWLVSQNYKGDGTPPALADDVRTEAAKRYIQAYERITGLSFQPDLSDPIARMMTTLSSLMKLTGTNKKESPSMSHTHAHVIVTLKSEVLDPQGEAVRRALQSLGIENLQSVRVGKFIDIEITSGTDSQSVHEQLERAASQLLANPVIENFKIEYK